MARGIQLSNTVRLVSGGATIAVAAALLAGCGGSSSSASSSAPTSAGSNATGSGSISASSPTSTASASASAVKLGNSDSSFCQKARAEESESQSDATALEAGNPADLEKIETKALAELPAFVNSAPAEIKGAAQTLAAADQTLFTALKAANFDFTKINPSSISVIETPAFTQASEKISTYLATKCGIDISDSPSG